MKTMPITPEQVQKANDGDSEALEQIIKEMRVSINVHAKTVARGNQAVFWDLVEQAPTIIWESLHRYDPEKSQPKTFLSKTLEREFRSLDIESRAGMFGVSSSAYSRYWSLQRTFDTEEERLEHLTEFGISEASYLGIQNIERGVISIDPCEDYHPDVDDMADGFPSDDRHDQPVFNIEEYEPSAPAEPTQHDSMEVVAMLALAELTDNELQVVRLFYGVDGELEMSTKQIAEEMEITMSRVRSLKAQALTKLRKGAK